MEEWNGGRTMWGVGVSRWWRGKTEAPGSAGEHEQRP